MSTYGTLNPHFNFYSNPQEQEFYADFIDEEIRLAGVEVLYIPKSFDSIDYLLGEPYQSLHDRFYPMAVRMTDIMGYSGQPDVMTQLGIQFQPACTVIISKRMFRSLKITDRLLRPHEGDLLLVGSEQSTATDPIYSNSLFEITYVPREASTNWPLGKYYQWDVKCELYNVSYEKFNTGNAHIDRINSQYNNPSDLKQGINKGLEDKKPELIDFSEQNPFSGL
jgi:hypothetical protein